MPRYVVLLRGINVGRGRVVRMADLRALLEQAGGTDVATYIQSGNVVMTHAQRSATRLAAELEPKITKLAGFAVPVVVFTAAEWRAVIAANPFADDDLDHLHAALLAIAPKGWAFDDAPFAPERCAAVGRVVYLHLPGGMGRSKLAVALQRDKTAGAATARNWRSVLAIDALAYRSPA